MEKHVTVLGVLCIAFSALGILAAIIVFTAVVGGGLISGDSEAMTITAIVGPTIAFFVKCTLSHNTCCISGHFSRVTKMPISV
jgi:hypothetical protein